MGNNDAVDAATQLQLQVVSAEPRHITHGEELREAKEKLHQSSRMVTRYIARLEGALARTIDAFTIISEIRDPYTAGHEKRVAEIAKAIGKELGLNEHRQKGLSVAGRLHDIGKIIVPSDILSYPKRPTVIQFDYIKQHAQSGYDILRGVDFPWPIALVALQHHERIDGSGYPKKLKGDEILLESRIMAVADVVESMSSHRPYRPSLGIEAALNEIKDGSGIRYDHNVASACLCLFEEKRLILPEKEYLQN